MRTKKPDHYIFPAIFNYADDGISISFSDFSGCLSCGDDQKEAMYMAQDVLAGFLSLMEDEGESIPEPSDLRSIHTEPNEAVVLVGTPRRPPRRGRRAVRCGRPRRYYVRRKNFFCRTA